MGTRTLLVAMTMLLPLATQAQLTLEECKQRARDNYPMVKQYALLDRSRDYDIDNIAKMWLPQVGVTGGTAAFTDVLSLPLQMQDVDGGSNNWAAGLAVSVQQKIWDAGKTNAQQNMVRAENVVSRSHLDVNMYAIYSRVEQLYFGVMLLNEQIKQNKLLLSELGINEKQVTNLMKGGLASVSDLDAVRVEEVRCRQNEAALMASRQAYMNMLGCFIGRQLADTTTLLPTSYSYEGIRQDTSGRPEMQWYAARKSLLDCQRKQLDSSRMPTVSAFGTALAHTNLSDMMHNTLAAVGVSVSWNIGALYTRKTDLRKLQNEADRIDAEQQTFLFNNRLEASDAQGQINSLKRQLSLDEEAVRLRQNIYAKSMTKVRLGTETVNEMLRDAIAVSQARQQQSLHSIQLQQAICHQKTILGQ